MAKQEFNFKIDDASEVFFTSDTHFNHDNIIHFCKRPFKTVEEMNETLIENWNKVVGENSLVFHLGDFAWSNKWGPILERLNGRKILIKGNHDVKNLPQKSQLDLHLDGVFQQLYLRIEGRPVYLNHFPYLCYTGVYRNVDTVIYQLFGHIHYSKNSPTGKDIKRMDYLFPTQYDVGVDNNNFTPISWHEVDSIIKKQMETNTNMAGIKIEIEKG